MKLKLPLIAVAFCLTFNISAQTSKIAIKNSNLTSTKTDEVKILYRTCATPEPDAAWNNWFNQKVNELIQAKASGKAQAANYTIPVVVHVIHGGQAVGSFPNLAQAQINSQITVLNQDFGAVGYNISNLPSVFAAANANTDVSFCLAQKDPNGVTLSEPGIDRISYVAKGWNNPASATYNTPTTFRNYMENTIKPGSIWDPTRYLNIWISDVNSGTQLLGYATFPGGTGLTGLSSFGTATTDGVWCWSRAIGSNILFSGGTYDPTFNKGRTATHEIGHWLGLRHIGGDGSCATDYCTDTPTQKGGFGGGQFGQNYGCPTHPYVASGECSGTTAEMFMNFMDYTDDPCMYMFTNDQKTRIQTAMANGTYRSQLTASSASLCSLSASTPTANFNIVSSGCINTAIATTNLSNGTPAPTYSWSSNPSSGVTFNPNSTANAPTVNFSTPGSYSITVVATNSLGSSSNVKVITIASCSVGVVCADTLTNFGPLDTLNVYRGAADVSVSGCSPNAGYVVGSNCYGDLEKAEFYPISKYSTIVTPQVKSVIVLFFKNGNLGTSGNTSSTVGLRLYNSSSTTFTGMPSGIAPNSSIGFTSTTLGTILSQPAVTNVNYCGVPSFAFGSPIIIPYRFVFATPVNVPTSTGFFASLILPTGAGDTAVVFNNDNATTSTSYERWSPASPATWYEIKTAWGGSTNYNIAILPEMQCAAPTSINKSSVLDVNVSIHPNPSTGLLNVIATLPNAQTLDILIHNSLGQLISSSKHSGVTSNVFSIDMANYSNGVYFVTISNGQEKIMKRLILNK